jgi:hypothetical protein
MESFEGDNESKELHEIAFTKVFQAVFNRVLVAQPRTRLGIPGDETERLPMIRRRPPR